MILSLNGIIAGKGSIPMDTDAQAFITAASITDSTQQNAINQLVLDLKSANIWTKMKAIYPFVGGTASSHKWNLKDPRPVAGAFYLDFYGGGTHSANGYKPDGATAYADTKLTPNSTISSVNSMALSNYSRTSNTSVSGSQMGCYDGVQEVSLYQYYSVILRKGGSMYQYPSEAVLSENPITQGLQINSRTSSTSFKLYFNNSLLITNTATRTFTLPSRSIYLGASNWSAGATQFTPHEHAFDSISDGLSDSEATALYNAVQTFQTTLGRQV